eukprot:1124487-Pleurochrysis_carterae.AAC.1
MALDQANSHAIRSRSCECCDFLLTLLGYKLYPLCFPMLHAFNAKHRLEHSPQLAWFLKVALKYSPNLPGSRSDYLEQGKLHCVVQCVGRTRIGKTKAYRSVQASTGAVLVPRPRRCRNEPQHDFAAPDARKIVGDPCTHSVDLGSKSYCEMCWNKHSWSETAWRKKFIANRERPLADSYFLNGENVVHIENIGKYQLHRLATKLPLRCRGMQPHCLAGKGRLISEAEAHSVSSGSRSVTRKTKKVTCTRWRIT